MLRCLPSVSHPPLKKFDALPKQAIQRITRPVDLKSIALTTLHASSKTPLNYCSHHPSAEPQKNSKISTPTYLARARRGRFEDSSLHFARQSRIHRQNDQLRNLGTQRFHALVQNLTRRVNLLLTRQEQQNITLRRNKTSLTVCKYTSTTVQFHHLATTSVFICTAGSGLTQIPICLIFRISL